MGKSDCGKQCDKHCSVYKMHTYFQRLYRVSWGLTITEIVAFFLILLRVAILHCWGPVPIDPVDCLEKILQGVYLPRLKDIAMTVGLTGVLFAWLLQIIGEQTCSIPTDELFQYEFHGYIWQIFLFIQATIIWQTSPQNTEVTDTMVQRLWKPF